MYGLGFHVPCEPVRECLNSLFILHQFQKVPFYQVLKSAFYTLSLGINRFFLQFPLEEQKSSQRIKRHFYPRINRGTVHCKHVGVLGIILRLGPYFKDKDLVISSLCCATVYYVGGKPYYHVPQPGKRTLYSCLSVFMSVSPTMAGYCAWYNNMIADRQVHKEPTFWVLWGWVEAKQTNVRRRRVIKKQCDKVQKYISNWPNQILEIQEAFLV